ncbi:hypothetical protein A2U01_0098897, partial [Trifolium medium]|nr:hypothetical protein [Trifolium medium]
MHTVVIVLACEARQLGVHALPGL